MSDLFTIKPAVKLRWSLRLCIVCIFILILLLLSQLTKMNPLKHVSSSLYITRLLSSPIFSPSSTSLTLTLTCFCASSDIIFESFLLGEFDSIEIAFICFRDFARWTSQRTWNSLVFESSTLFSDAFSHP